MFGFKTIALIISFSFVILYKTVKIYNEKEHEECERVVLEKYIKKTKFIVKQVLLKDGTKINTLITQNNINNDKPILVLVHGWSSGLALWCKNIDGLSTKYQIYAIDLLGFGRSSRKEFNGSTGKHAQEFWVENIKLWSDELNLKKFNLLGHSLGGFVSLSFALKYPKYINNLFLVAAVGIAPWNFNNPKFKTLKRQILLNLVLGCGFTLQGFIRSFSIFSYKLWMKLGERIDYRDLGKVSWEYLYYNQIAPVSGGKAFTNWQVPMYEELTKLKVNTRLIYGKYDYVKPQFGSEVVKKCNFIKCDYVVINSNHHMYWNEPINFNNSVLNF